VVAKQEATKAVVATAGGVATSAVVGKAVAATSVVGKATRAIVVFMKAADGRERRLDDLVLDLQVARRHGVFCAAAQRIFGNAQRLGVRHVDLRRSGERRRTRHGGGAATKSAGRAMDGCGRRERRTGEAVAPVGVFSSPEFAVWGRFTGSIDRKSRRFRYFASWPDCQLVRRVCLHTTELPFGEL
jgi:hypothetical protein